MAERYFDDFREGERFFTRGATLTESMILDFAQRFDPQPFHMDVEAARDSIYGGLIASGWHSLALSSRLVLSERVFAACSMGAPGLDDLRWLRPVRPGDTLRVAMEVKEKRPSQSNPDRGILRMLYEVSNQNDELVLTYIINHLLRRRGDAGE